MWPPPQPAPSGQNGLVRTFKRLSGSSSSHSSHNSSLADINATMQQPPMSSYNPRFEYPQHGGAPSMPPSYPYQQQPYYSPGTSGSPHDSQGPLKAPGSSLRRNASDSRLSQKSSRSDSAAPLSRANSLLTMTIPERLSSDFWAHGGSPPDPTLSPSSNPSRRLPKTDSWTNLAIAEKISNTLWPRKSSADVPLSPVSNGGFQSFHPPTIPEGGKLMLTSDQPNGNQNIRCRRLNMVLLALLIIIIIIIVAAVAVKVSNSSATSALDGTNKVYTKGNYTIELDFGPGIAKKYQDLITAAADRWETIIMDELPTVTKLPAGTAGCTGFANTTQATDRLIQNLLVFVSVSSIDGESGTLAQSGPCRFDANKFPRTGTMKFDSSDLEDLFEDKNLQNVAEHELGHILGLGTTWDTFKLITPAGQSGPILYLGARGTLGLSELGGSGNPVVEDTGGAGEFSVYYCPRRGTLTLTLGLCNRHWSENTYRTELMTGFFFSNVAPLSRMTVRALEDLGYTVAASNGDAYTLPRRRRLRGLEEESAPRQSIGYGNDVFTGPYYKIFGDLKPGREMLRAAGDTSFWDSLLSD